MSDNDDLEPCPFCGRSDLLHVERHHRSRFLHVHCWACGANGPAKRALTEKEAHANWNQRSKQEGV